MEYRITLPIDRCTALTLRFLAASWWKIHLHVVEFLSAIFACFHFRLYRPWLSSYSIVWSIVRFVFISVKLDLFVARHVIKSLTHKEETSLNISGKEVDVARHKQRICHRKSINIQQSFCLSRRATLYRKELININRNLDKAVYKKEDFKRQDRRRWFSVSFTVFIRQLWNGVCKRDSCST